MLGLVLGKRVLVVCSIPSYYLNWIIIHHYLNLFRNKLIWTLIQITNISQENGFEHVAYTVSNGRNDFHSSNVICEMEAILVRPHHYTDVIMGTIASQITSFTIVYSIVHSAADQRKYQSSASLAFVWGIHRRPVNSPLKWPVKRKMFLFDDVIMTEFR